jgi:hypothetical protein
MYAAQSSALNYLVLENLLIKPDKNHKVLEPSQARREMPTCSSVTRGVEQHRMTQVIKT